jgi:hypothetical protein
VSKFFKPEDFLRVVMGKNMDANIAAAANAKLEREGKAVTGFYVDLNKGKFPEEEHWLYTDKTKPRDTHTALLINIEPIAACTHPKEKVTYTPYSHQNTNDHDDWAYICSCGARVTPSNFEVMK